MEGPVGYARCMERGDDSYVVVVVVRSCLIGETGYFVCN